MTRAEFQRRALEYYGRMPVRLEEVAMMADDGDDYAQLRPHFIKLQSRAAARQRFRLIRGGLETARC